MTDIDEFRKLLEIEKGALDDEIVRQPQLFFSVSDAYIEAAAHRDALKEDLSTTDSKLDGEIRRKYGNSEKKVTDATVKSEIQSHKLHKQAFETFMQAKELADRWSALKEAFSQRSYMLRDLCSLYVNAYYERSTVETTHNMDTAVYNDRRKKIATARRERERIK